MNRLINYEHTINKFYTEAAIGFLDASFDLYPDEKSSLNHLLEHLYQPLSKLDYDNRKPWIKQLKEKCERDWSHYMLREYSQISDIHQPLLQSMQGNKDSQRNQALFHTAVRFGEFFYMTDSEMRKMSENIDRFIEAGDCKLFDYAHSPYQDIPLTNTFEGDIVAMEEQVRSYLQDHGMEDLSSSQILGALGTLENWVDQSDLTTLPDSIRGMIQFLRELKLKYRKSDLTDLDRLAIQPEHIMTKLSGFCLNREPQFREFLSYHNMEGWKNPEGSWLYGTSQFPWPDSLHKDMKFLPWWNMDYIAYSLGKGPWDKCRYVGQPCPHYQNIMEPYADTYKRTMRWHQEKYDKGELGIYDASGLNIYDNYISLLNMVRGMSDSIAMDFSAYSDYLSRNVFHWICIHLLGLPEPVARMILFLMGLPVRVGSKIYHHLHSSVMGIKFNFVLITLSNFVMWAVACIILNTWDSFKAMGDDRLQTKYAGTYSKREIGVFFSVTAYFNCVVNPSKTEVLSRDGFTSFCKRTFNCRGEQISGFSGEYSLKQKPFLNDCSGWISVCLKSGIPLSDSNVDKYLQYHLPLIQVAYNKFCTSEDPPLDELILQSRKISYQYGGLGCFESDDEMDQVMMRSVLHLVQVMIEEANQETETRNSRFYIREYLRKMAGEDNMYYKNLLSSHSYSQDLETVHRLITTITDYIGSDCSTLEDAKKARGACHRLMEIVLDRDSRLAGSISTKNRIEVTFDQDRVSKIRCQYLEQAGNQTKEEYLGKSLFDGVVLKDLLTTHGHKNGFLEYHNYRKAVSKTGCDIVFYCNAYSVCYSAMTVRRYDKVKKKWISLKVRLSALESDYDRASKDSKGGWHGQFYPPWDLTPDERIVYDYLKQDSTRKFTRQIEELLNRSFEDTLRRVASYVIGNTKL